MKKRLHCASPEHSEAHVGLEAFIGNYKTYAFYPSDRYILAYAARATKSAYAQLRSASAPV